MTILTYFAVLSIIVLFLYVSRETVCLCLNIREKVQKTFDRVFHVEHYMSMNIFESGRNLAPEDVSSDQFDGVHYPDSEKLKELTKKYQYNSLQVATMRLLGFGDSNYQLWIKKYSEDFGNQFVAYLIRHNLYDDSEGSIDVAKAASEIATYMKSLDEQSLAA